MKSRGVLLIVAGLTLPSCSSGGSAPEAETKDFVLNSQAFGDGDVMPVEFTCDGDDISPPLRWSTPPAGTKSYAVTMTDIDAPMGSFRHWGIYNIPLDRRFLKAGDGLPNSGSFSQVLNGKEDRQYMGPCPPAGSGPHRYRFKVIALDKDQFELSENTSVGGLEEAAIPRKLAEAELTVTYQRK